MQDKIYNVLFICTDNSARSVMAEGLMNELRSLDSLAIRKELKDIGSR